MQIVNEKESDSGIQNDGGLIVLHDCTLQDCNIVLFTIFCIPWYSLTACSRKTVLAPCAPVTWSRSLSSCVTIISGPARIRQLSLIWSQVENFLTPSSTLPEHWSLLREALSHNPNNYFVSLKFPKR